LDIFLNDDADRFVPGGDVALARPRTVILVVFLTLLVQFVVRRHHFCGFDGVF
jgi:hypothetical protein